MELAYSEMASSGDMGAHVLAKRASSLVASSYLGGGASSLLQGGYELVSHKLALHSWCRLASSEFTYPG